MGTYLEDYLESMYMLPSEIKRNFDLMRELDKTSYPLLDELKNSQKTYLVNARQKVQARCADKTLGEPTEAELRELVAADETQRELRDTHARVVQKLDEKIAIAAQSYDIVDHHIRRLDRDLESYAALLKANGEYAEEGKSSRKRQKLSAGSATAGSSAAVHHVHAHSAGGLPPHAPHPRSKHSMPVSGVSGSLSSKDRTGSTAQHTKASSAGAAGAANGSRKRSGMDTALKTPALPADVGLLAPEDLPIDPNEPIYCHCRRVSFGQMVGCDNDDCKYEWFHFGCVGLSDQPAGKWYCQDCKALLGIK